MFLFNKFEVFLSFIGLVKRKNFGLIGRFEEFCFIFFSLGVDFFWIFFIYLNFLEIINIRKRKIVKF